MSWQDADPFQVPYEFIGNEDTFFMAIDKYIGDLVHRKTRDGFPLPELVARDAKKILDWKAGLDVGG